MDEMLTVLASAVILGSELQVTHETLVPDGSWSLQNLFRWHISHGY
jgi:hypothetical protein